MRRIVPLDVLGLVLLVAGLVGGLVTLLFGPVSVAGSQASAVWLCVGGLGAVVLAVRS